jgi:hypothetical protein
MQTFRPWTCLDGAWTAGCRSWSRSALTWTATKLSALPSHVAAATEGPEPFDRHLRTVISRYGLTSLFRDAGPGRHHHATKPTGYDDDVDAVIPEAMAQWRATYRALPEPHQIIAATIIWLYRGGPDTVWLRRVAVAWPAADAIALLRAADALADWGLLIALFPGW